LRNPISRVRSVTETSMMFMMPMPPTSSDTPPMPISSQDMVLVDSAATSLIEERFCTVKSSSPSWVR
jgi:hypothetical protein